MRTNQSIARLGTFAAFIGASLLFAGTLLHPTENDPNVPVAAFTEYAANTFWVWSHLMQFAGVLGLSLAFVAFASTFESGRPAAWARLGLAGTIAIMAVSAALQAVDGVTSRLWWIAGRLLLGTLAPSPSNQRLLFDKLRLVSQVY